MNIFDADLNQMTTFELLEPKCEQYKFYCKGEEIKFLSKEDLKRQIQQYPQNAAIVVQRKERVSRQPEVRVEKLIKLLKKQKKHNESELELVGSRPESLFQNRLYNFKYELKGDMKQVAKERQDELVSDFLQGGNKWKQASLQQMQVISKNYDKILNRVCKNL